MQYKPAIVSPPILVSETKEIAIGGLGDTLNISLDVVYDTELNLEAKDPLPLTPKTSVSLSMKHKGIIDVITRGESFDITVELTEALTTDTTVEYLITESEVVGWDSIRSIKEINNTEDTFDYSRLLTSLPSENLNKTSGTIIIPAGSLSASDTVTSTANTNIFYGKGSYFSSKVELVSVDNDLLINPLNIAYVLYEDAVNYPKWGGGSVELWGKLPHLSYFQPIYDADTNAIVQWDFGYDPTLTDTILRTKQTDDTPYDSLQFRVSGVPLDVENDTPIDLTITPPFYKVVIVAGRRD